VFAVLPAGQTAAQSKEARRENGGDQITCENLVIISVRGRQTQSAKREASSEFQDLRFIQAPVGGPPGWIATSIGGENDPPRIENSSY
jgi:hypothetical protein